MSLKESIRSFFGIEGEGNEEQMKPEVNWEDSHSQDIEGNSKERNQSSPVQKSKGNVIPMSQRSSVPKTSIHVIEPRVYSESQKMADLLLQNESVLLNFRRMEKDQAVKIIDFMMGCVYALQGDIQEVGEGIFLCTPAAVEIASTNKEEYENFY